jgi:hypothetical protein
MSWDFVLDGIYTPQTQVRPFAICDLRDLVSKVYHRRIKFAAAEIRRIVTFSSSIPKSPTCMKKAPPVIGAAP